MVNYISNKLFAKVKHRVFGEFPKLSYSRAGEDLWIDDYFRSKATGYYVDVGAYHPVDYSNTFKFYLKGWRGINIDPNQEVIELFDQIRPRDQNFNFAISDIRGPIDYFMNKWDPSMNTISPGFARETSSLYGFDIAEKRTVERRRLDEVLEAVRDKLPKIDFLNVDVEGHDLEVLQSNDWDRFRPTIVLAEINAGLGQVKDSAVSKLLFDKGYSLTAYTSINPAYGNGFFVDSKVS